MSEEKARLSASVYLFLLRSGERHGYESIMRAINYEGSYQSIWECMEHMVTNGRITRHSNGLRGRAARSEFSVHPDCYVPHGVRLSDLLSAGFCEITALETAT